MAIRIGLLDAGAMGAGHASAYARLPDVEVVGVFARDEARAQAVAKLCGAKPFTDAAALIGQATVDAIDVCLPSAVHAAFVIPALGRGKHVFCESPLALRLNEARQMRDAARRAGRLLQVGLLMRSVGAYAHVRDAVGSGTYGRLLSLATWRLGSYLWPGAPDHKAHYGDPSTELMTFDFDAAQWLMGRPAWLSASVVRMESGTPGEISALLAYNDGRHATIAASGLMPSGSPFSTGFRALFERAAFELRMVFDDDGPPRSTFTMAGETGPPSPVALPGRNPYEVELRRFVDCIEGRADPELLDVERAIDALVLSLVTQRALIEGRIIEIGSI
ncbi:MAG: Gfo/Idh/MocA family oxidoreductase [Reyranella sp.]|nr:Gfo/Idh/MocA family oxidoreductase [Reyranella sp.]MDP3159074.1 Gfo/Idh/MocA family oxidoreductase [Reyranella sp.]